MATTMPTQSVTLAVGNAASPEVFTTIAQVVNISGPDGSATEIDTTALDSAAKTFRVGLKDEGSVGFTINYDADDAQHAALRTALGSTTSKNYRITLTDTSPAKTYTFAAYVQQFALDISPDDVVKANASLRITGAITVA